MSVESMIFEVQLADLKLPIGNPLAWPGTSQELFDAKWAAVKDWQEKCASLKSDTSTEASENERAAWRKVRSLFRCTEGRL